MLIQAANIYTPKLFLKFQEQYEEFQGAFVKQRVERNAIHEYIVSIYGKPKDCRVIWNPFEKIVSCSCTKFERGGILCSHALKILDVMDMKFFQRNTLVRDGQKMQKTRLCKTLMDVISKLTPSWKLQLEISFCVQCMLSLSLEQMNVRKHTS